MNQDMLRIVEGIAREKNIDRESVLSDIEAALVSAVRKHFGNIEDVSASIDRKTGDMQVLMEGKALDVESLGRIAAQTAKQVMIQKIREDERGSIFEDFTERKGTIVSGTVSRIENGVVAVTLNRGEGFLPRSEQIPGETQQPGERIRCMVLDVREVPSQVKIVLSRTHPDFIRRLFELEVPEVTDKTIEVKAMAREAGYRTKIAVASIDAKVDAVGACVGVRGSRIKNIVDELGGEKIDIVRWNESSQILIANALKPAELKDIHLCFELGRATVVVNDDQLSLAIGKRGQNVRLAARLTGWDIDILTPAEFNQGLEALIKTLRGIEDIPDETIDKIVAMGMISLLDIEEVGAEPLIQELEMDKDLAEKVAFQASEAARQFAAEKEAAKTKAQQEARDQAKKEEEEEKEEETKDEVSDDEKVKEKEATAEPMEPAVEV